MKNVAIIGAGQLGFRHLQGLANSRMAANIWIVDPNTSNLERCKDEYKQRNHMHELLCACDISELPKKLDFAIISTTADVRLSVLKRLVSNSKVDAILFEKVLFQSEEQCIEAAEILRRIESKCWVNCPNREYEHIKLVRKYLWDDKILQFDVSGGDWGLACNSIHYLDLIKFVSNGNGQLTVGNHGLENGWIPSKRKNFVELTGSLVGKYGDVSYSLSSYQDSAMPSLMTIRGERKTCIVDFDQEIILLQEPTSRSWEIEKFRTPYQSELTGDLFDRICSNGVILLPSALESIEIHRPMLNAFRDHLQKSGAEFELCPIT